MGPEHDITPLLGLKLPQLQLGRFPINEVVDIGAGVVGHVYFLRSGATMFAEEKERALLSAGAAVFIGRALEFFMPRVVSKTLATPLRRRGLSI